MKKLITANDIREAHARGEQAMSVVLRASIITPEAREVADLLGFTITECDESIPVTASVPASVPADKTESQRIRETIIAQLPEDQFTESLVAQLMEKVMKEKQSLEQGAMQPSFKSVTGKGGIKVIDGSSVKFGRFDGAQPHCVGLTDLVTGDDGSSVWENEECVSKWRNFAAHRMAQEHGRMNDFADYKITVVTPVRSYTMMNRTEAPADSNEYLEV